MEIFEFHTGIKPEIRGEQSVMTCPFCMKEDHFFYNNTTLLWDCKVCGRTGNPVSFMQQIYALFDNLTKTSQEIGQLRGLPMQAVHDCKLKFNSMNGSYLIPTFRNGTLNNLYKAVYIPVEKNGTVVQKLIVMATPKQDHTLMNWEESTHEELWITEGHWDRLAANAVIGSSPISVTGVPGANVWKRTWTEYLNEKDIVFIYDKDEAGKSGLERVIIQHIHGSNFFPRSIRYVEWPEDKPRGYDLNDAYKEYGKGTLSKIREWMVPYKPPENIVVTKTTIETIAADKSVDSYEKLIEKFETVYHTTDAMRLGVLLVLSSIYSVKLEGEQIWVRLIGPPSSGKTSIAKVMSGSSQVVLKSTFTGLFSGWKDKDDDSDASLVPMIAGKTLIVKDADALLKQKNVEQIFSELRDFYDKDSSTFYKNRVSNDYRNIRSTMILCGTYVLRRSDQSFLGERFLDFVLELADSDREQIENMMLEKSIKSAIDPNNIPPETPVIAAGKGFIEYLMERTCNVHLGPKERNNALTWARLAATFRTKVDREQFGQREIQSQPIIEVPARLIGQLVKLYNCATVVLGLERPNLTVHRLVAKVTKDIMDMESARMKIAVFIKDDFKKRQDIVEALELPVERVTREIYDMLALGIIDVRKETLHQVGRATMTVRLKTDLKNNLDHLLNYV